MAEKRSRHPWRYAVELPNSRNDVRRHRHRHNIPRRSKQHCRKCDQQFCDTDRQHRTSRRIAGHTRSEEHTSELQSRLHLVCRLLLENRTTASLPETFCSTPSFSSSASAERRRLSPHYSQFYFTYESSPTCYRTSLNDCTPSPCIFPK